MTLEILLGLVRHIATVVGGLLVAKGVIGESDAELYSGAVVAIAGALWSVYDKVKANKAAAAKVAQLMLVGCFLAPMFFLSACGKDADGERIVNIGDGKFRLAAQAKADFAAARDLAIAGKDKIGEKCWTHLYDFASALPEGEIKVVGPAHGIQLTRNMRRAIESDDFKLECGPLVQDGASRILSLAALLGL